MAIVDISTEATDFDTRAAVLFPGVTLASGNSYMFYLSAIANPENVRGAYYVVTARFNLIGPNAFTPLIVKVFPGTPRTVFKLAVPRIRDTDNQRIRVRILPKEFYRGSSDIRQLDVTLSYEDTLTYPLGLDFP